ncbi:single insulin-like growth factor-binding domain protein-2 isoform X3 [Oratosquilla oratoria]|uniref:single insulin-like growth factor-binding domain protein-2 isoform X3 n=1 Tax=Oratosquilla oratoria TaxID=337810 RepID=UPI003F765491
MGLQTGPHLLLLLLGILAFVQRNQGLSCAPCDDVNCDPLDPATCPAGIAVGVCECCTICAKGPGQACGSVFGDTGEKCGTGLRCWRGSRPSHGSRGFCVSEDQIRSLDYADY